MFKDAVAKLIFYYWGIWLRNFKEPDLESLT